jgi:WD40 repeat protein
VAEGAWFSLVPYGDYIVATRLKDGDFTVHLWNTKGEYLGQVGRVGKGPGEYQAPLEPAFINEDSFVVFDRALATMSRYKIEKGEIAFVDQENRDELFDAYIDTMFARGGKLYMISYSGPKRSYRVYTLDKELKLIKKSLRRTFIPKVAFLTATLGNNRFYICEDYAEIGKMYRPVIYEIGFSGEVLRTITIPHKDIYDIHLDKSQKVFLSGSIKNALDPEVPKTYYLYDVNGNALHEFSSFELVKRVERCGSSTQSHDSKLLIMEKPNLSGEAKLHIYELNIGLEPLEGDEA